MNQIGTLDITRSKTFQGFQSYVKQIGHIRGHLGQNKSNLLNTEIKYILKLNHTSMTSIITQAQSMRIIDLQTLIQVSQTELHNAVAGHMWNWNQMIQSIKSTT